MKARVKMWAIKFPGRFGKPPLSDKWIYATAHEALGAFRRAFGETMKQEAKSHGGAECKLVRVEVREL